jgi:hypothetical protein
LVAFVAAAIIGQRACYRIALVVVAAGVAALIGAISTTADNIWFWLLVVPGCGAIAATLPIDDPDAQAG